MLLVAVCIAAGLGIKSLAGAQGFRRYLSLQREMGRLVEQRRQLSEQNRHLRDEIRALREDPEALEQAAREELGFTKPGEIILNVE